MKTFIIVILCLIVGGAVGGFLALGYGAGMGVASGLVIGSQAGVCLAVETAREQQLLTDENADQTVSAAIEKIKGRVALPPDSEFQWAGSEADCATMIAELQKALAEAEQQTGQ
jgi:hypothetical protein